MIVQGYPMFVRTHSVDVRTLYAYISDMVNCLLMVQSHPHNGIFRPSRRDYLQSEMNGSGGNDSKIIYINAAGNIAGYHIDSNGNIDKRVNKNRIGNVNENENEGSIGDYL